MIYISPGSYSANFVASIQTTKSVSGPNQIQIKIPVAVNATVTGSTATLSSCGMSVAATAKGCRFCANFCGNGYPTDGGIIAAHWKDWDYVNTYGNGCTGAMNWDISNRVHLCCAN